MIKKIRPKIFFVSVFEISIHFKVLLDSFQLQYQYLSMIEVGLICKMSYKFIPIFRISVGLQIFIFSPELTKYCSCLDLKSFLCHPHLSFHHMFHYLNHFHCLKHVWIPPDYSFFFS
ncbi:hypothetical protein C0J52_19909 [Blattella germanica]|nr:hypothetical protein C0J52_19909 [Blattella germanica]